MGFRDGERSVAYDVTDRGTILYVLKGKELLNAFIVPMPRSWVNRLTAHLRECADATCIYWLYGSNCEGRVCGKLLMHKVGSWPAYYPQIAGRMLLLEAVRNIPDRGRLMIIPDESLHTLPFQALDLGWEKTPTIEWRRDFIQDHIAVYYYPSARTLTALRSRAGSPEMPTRTLVVADDREDWPVKESEYLRKLKPKDMDCYLGLPSRDFLGKADLRRYRYVVFIGHGGHGTTFRDTMVVLNLKGKKGAEGNVFLTASDLMRMPLNADLACFHTCSTGIDEEVAGEAMNALGTAALFSGAKSALMTLWPTSSWYARQWAQHFYPAVFKGEKKLDALRKSHLQIWKENEAEANVVIQMDRRNPRHWAPFILVGEPD